MIQRKAALRRLTVGIILACVVATRSPADEFFSEDLPPRFTVLTRREGLPNNAVSSIQQDSRGFLWMGTQGGLVRYDGRSFHTYTNRPFAAASLPHDLVQTIYYDETSDTVWAGTYRGLARLKPGEDRFQSYRHHPDQPGSLSNDVVIAISRGPDGRLWVGTQSGLNRMNDEGTFDRIEIDTEVIRDLHLDTNGTLWIAGHNGLSRWDRARGAVVPVELDLPSPFVMTIDERDPGTLVLGTWGVDPHPGGVAIYRVGRGIVRTYEVGGNEVYTVLAGSDGTLWAGTWGDGLYAIARDGRRYEFRADAGLASPVVYSLFEDQAGVVWVGTNGGGVHPLSPRRRNFRRHWHEPGRDGSLPAGKINALLRDSRGTLWAGLYSGGLAYHDPATDRWVAFRHDTEDQHSLANNIVSALFEDRDGSLLVGSHRGLQRLDRRRARFDAWGLHIHQDVPLRDKIVYALTRDRDGRYWIGTYRHGIIRYDPAVKDVRFYRNNPADPGSLTDNLVYDILVTDDGAVWIATNGGLNRYRPQTDDFAVYRYDESDSDGLTSNTARALYEDSRGTLWIGTISGGALRLRPDGNGFDHFTTASGLSSNSVVSISEGQDGRVWFGTLRGLSALDPETDAITVLDERDGLYGSEFHSGVHREPEGKILFGGAHGITEINATDAAANTHAPVVHITDVRVLQESVDPAAITFNDRRLEIGPEETFVSVEFVGLDYEASMKNEYRYRLRGFNEDWVSSGSRNVATYTNLPSGTYEFEVLSGNPDGRWSEAPARLQLVVAAPWYRRWWAVVIFVAAAVVVSLGVWRVRLAGVLAEKNQQLEHAVSQLGVANRELERLSVNDALTGIFNRRYFDEHLQDEWRRALRAGASVTLLIIDIDWFKRYNDAHGHVAGDHVLASVAHLLRDNLSRETDFVARYGGEEFAALLYETPLDGAAAVAERMRGAVERARLGSEQTPVTVSIGVAALQPSARITASQLIEAADAALYRAKHGGRNRVEVARSA